MTKARSAGPVRTLADARASKKAALTIGEGAALLSLDPRTVSAAISAGDIPAIRVGRRVLIPRERFLALFETTPASDR